MNISKLDENFKNTASKTDRDVVYYSVTKKPFDLYGVFYDNEEKLFLRISKDVAKATSENVFNLNKFTAGGRVKFSTDAKELFISVKWEGLFQAENMPLTCTSSFILLEERQGKYFYIGKATPTFSDNSGMERSITLARGFTYAKNYYDRVPETNEYLKAEQVGVKNYILFFPTYNQVSELKLGFNGDAKVFGGSKYKDIPPIIFYGSSITHGGSPSRPDTCYEPHISKWNNVNFINLGFSGNAKGEKVIAEYISTLPASVFVLDYDHNAPDKEHLKNTHYAFYKIYRDKNPDTPIIFMSKPDCDSDFSAEKRRLVIEESYNKAKASGDENAYYIDGRTLFGEEDRECCFSDGTHPNDLGHYRIAKRLNEIIKNLV